MIIPGTSYTFSAVKPEDLGETEYTLVTMAVDTTGSVSGFAASLLNMVKTVIEACKKNPRSENLLVRFTTFAGDSVTEVHGFKPLSTIDVNDYKPFRCNGATNLYDAVLEAVGATEQYAKTLSDNDFDVNSAIYIITDGEDNNSNSGASDVATFVERLKNKEKYGMMNSVLIGINTAGCSHYLNTFKSTAKLDSYVDIVDGTPGKLAKLAGFISKSISSSSQALSNGNTPVASLTF